MNTLCYPPSSFYCSSTSLFATRCSSASLFATSASQNATSDQILFFCVTSLVFGPVPVFPSVPRASNKCERHSAGLFAQSNIKCYNRSGIRPATKRTRQIFSPQKEIIEVDLTMCKPFSCPATCALELIMRIDQDYAPLQRPIRSMDSTPPSRSHKRSYEYDMSKLALLSTKEEYVFPSTLSIDFINTDQAVDMMESIVSAPPAKRRRGLVRCLHFSQLNLLGSERALLHSEVQ
jgi:hypothetical protein